MAKVNGTMTAIQFEDIAGKTITTGVSNVCFVKVLSRNLAFYGSKGRSELKDDEWESVHLELGLPLPVVKDDDDDDDADFVCP